jgi:hypothetical protein
MEQPEIECRRRELAEEYLSLPNAWCSRAFAICEEFGKLSEEETTCAGQAAGERIHACECA